ncbi:F5/8 type C domain-containing protein [Sinomicrobium oceani]|uniref:F5/8 type C domain-containing protein n=1 Tax=Sinomicrobium oceani TaxID=1150368 RepID=A0A1K1QB52_9FLAO|nr:discoidin domain-containing protein [Sinomicrobium oceani]SFW56937.1 F5/8 type C domain-containing protein [Sinomicrobium oceani]
MKTNTIFSVIACLAMVLFYSCVPDDAVPEHSGNPEEPVFSSEHPYNLNVIYFVSNDREVNADYEQRISKIMLEGQRFFADWMEHWGYGSKTFGLLRDENMQRVKIHLIHGTKSSDSYPYEGGASAVKEEVEAYFSEHPEEKTSDHNLIICAVNEKLDEGEDMEVGVPFYGIGRDAYALDYPGMSYDNLGVGGDVGWKATVWIGGLYHEMGHGLNLPHCGSKVSESESDDYGTSLMGAGNSTFGISPTFLAQSSAAIVNNCQVFSEENGMFYTDTNAYIDRLSAGYENGDIIVTGSYVSDVPVTDITYYHKVGTDSGGYRAITWVGEPTGEQSFQMRMPISEFQERGNEEYTFSIILHHENGNNTWTDFSYAFQSDIPDIHISIGQQNVYDKTNWQIIDVSSEETVNENGAVAHVLDGNPQTYWHSRWNTDTPGYPHYFVVDMKEELQSKGFVIYQRVGRRAINAYEIEVSSDSMAWETLAEGSLEDTYEQVITLAGETKFRYFRFTAKSSHDGEPFAALAEIGVYH